MFSIGLVDVVAAVLSFLAGVSAYRIFGKSIEQARKSVRVTLKTNGRSVILSGKPDQKEVKKLLELVR